MKLSKDLKFIFQVDTEEHGTVHVYTSPIKRETFELYFAELGAVFNRCFRGGDTQHLVVAGPSIAYAALKNAAIKDGTWAPEKGVGVQDGLINELIRLTHIAYAVPGSGWETVPMAVAQQRKILDEDSESEVLNNLVFFSAAFKVGPPKLMLELFEVMAQSRDWDFSSSKTSTTAFIASLPMLTAPATSTTAPPSVTVS